MKREHVTIDGNEAAAYVAHKLNEVICIYPITPSSNMGEWADEWSAAGRKNLWGTVPSVTEMQSEGGAAGAIHGALQTGALSTTFTASQGLLLMLPNMLKIAGELTSTVFHVSARTVASHALSIFGDHSDVMMARQTGFAMLASNSVQEVMDMALIAQAASLEGRLPVLHFFDGFRTSHEVMKIEQLTDDDLRAMIDDDLIRAHRERALTPENPVLRGTAQNPDVFFQARETVNPYYNAFPDLVQKSMDKFARVVGRKYKLFDYYGSPTAERVIVIMGSGAETVEETVDYLSKRGENIGMLKVRLFRPFDTKRFIEALPKSVKSIAVLDRTKEPGASGEPMYQDVLTAVTEMFINNALPFGFPKIIGGRYGLSSKEFTPAMVKAVYDEMKKDNPKNHFTVGINDDVTFTSLEYDHSFSTEPDDVVRAMFYGLGADGTVGANKNSIKIIGEDTSNYAQGYFVYDSKKSGSTTTSHLRFGPRPIHSTYLITEANFVACHQWFFLEKYDVLKNAVPGATFLLNSFYGPDQVWDQLPRHIQQQIIDKKIKFYVIDGYKVAQATGMGARVNTIMQTCFFAISGVLPKDEAIAAIKNSIKKTYGRKGDQIVQQNYAAVDQTLANLHEVKIPASVSSKIEMPPVVSDKAPDFVKNVTAGIIAGFGDSLPVSAFPKDGTFPTGTAQWEKRNIALEIPIWDETGVCIQCNKCAIVCPHAAIRVKVYDGKELAASPSTFKSMDYKGVEYKGMKYTVQVAPEDCTGCGICVDICPAKNKKETRLKAINMTEQPPIRESERVNYDYFLSLSEIDRRTIKMDSVKGSQFAQPLFEYSGACTGCGETPYVKLATQMFGDRMVVANATGCSSIYGGNLPTTPWTSNHEGRGPAWNNSLFEDNAEFGLGMRLSIDKQHQMALEIVEKMKSEIGNDLAGAILNANQSDEPGIYEQRQRVEDLKKKLAGMNSSDAKRLLSLADMLVKKSVWIMGGDGWAYDIGYGGLDHVLASGKNVNILVLDTEVYSNTGGQMSKSTPRAAVAKFAAAGKPLGKKDLGRIAMQYGNVYVAQIAMGYNDAQTVRAFMEAESYDGPSLIIAYSHCIAHGINMTKGMTNQKFAVECGHWPTYRFDPRLALDGKNPLKLDSKAPKIKFEEYAYMETRYKMLTKSHPHEAKELMKLAQEDVEARWKALESLAAETPGNGSAPKPEAPKPAPSTN
ncbi:MAG: pyruvate:ferredoxin (flavodoxin) oxidoreductase [Bacteroidetes bacterium]|nr:pyruvate:ferredoxin (flavodoxin) oxidoreductase [Bacteroidota bacterium]MCW5895704.1 pyruvate:ferredoxin (flavodoxin) oxidoreductase [Bacteroidota bacterium]